MGVFQEWQSEQAAKIGKGEPTLVAPHVVDPRTLPDPHEVEARRLRTEAMQSAFESIPATGGTLRVLRTPSAAELREAAKEKADAEKRANAAAAKVVETQAGIDALQEKIKAREATIRQEEGERRRAAVVAMMADITKDRATRGKRALDKNELQSRAVQRVAKAERKSR